MGRLCRFSGLVVACCSFAVALGARGQSDPKITLTVQASYAGVALQELGAAGHVQLLTSPQTARDVICFQLKDVPLSEAMARIAGAVDGTWKQVGQSYRLIRTAKQQSDESRKEFDETVRSIRKSIKKRADELQKMTAWNADEADALATKVQALIRAFNPKVYNGDWIRQGDQFSNQTPIGRALTKIVAALDPIELSSLPSHMKAVWSSNPTPTQKLFTSKLLPIGDEFVKGQADWAAAIDKHQLKAPVTDGFAHYVGGLRAFKDHANGTVQAILLSVTPQGPKNGFYCDLTAYDEKGKIIAQANTILSNSGADNKELPAMPTPTDEEKIKLDADALALLANRNTSPGRAKKLAGSLLNKLIRPEQFDPLSIFLSPKLIQAATIKKVNMVAHLTDDMFNPDAYFSTKETTVDDFLRKNVSSAGTVELTDGWLTVRPKRPSECRSRQADRTELGKYLRKLATGRPFSIDELAAFALSLPDTVDNFMPTSMSGFIRTERFDDYEPNMLRLYGLLTQNQKSTMANGGIRFGALGSEELSYVNRLIYKMRPNIGYQAPSGQPAEQTKADEEVFNSDLMREATELLPNGIPRQGLLTLELKNTNAAFAFVADSDLDLSGASGSAKSARELAWCRYSQERPDLFPVKDKSFTYNLNRVLFGRQVSMTFSFQFTPTILTIYALNDTNLRDFQSMTLNDLPDDFKKEFQDAYNHYVMVYANAKPGQLNGVGSGPPP